MFQRGSLSASSISFSNFSCPMKIPAVWRELQPRSAFRVNYPMSSISKGKAAALFEPSKNLNEDLKENIVICGDTVFAGSVGRVDLTGGTSMEELVGNINKRLMSLPDTTRLFPGHGPETLVSIEKQSNPYLGGFYNEF